MKKLWIFLVSIVILSGCTPQNNSHLEVFKVDKSIGTLFTKKLIFNYEKSLNEEEVSKFFKMKNNTHWFSGKKNLKNSLSYKIEIKENERILEVYEIGVFNKDSEIFINNLNTLEFTKLKSNNFKEMLLLLES